MRVAVIGTGVAGSAAAWALATGSPHEVVVYEREDRPGGHCTTVDVPDPQGAVPVDLGFMVYNNLTYPQLDALFAELRVATQPASMSFSVSVDGGRLEWAGNRERFLQALFAQRRNVVSPTHFRMLGDVLRFNRAAPADLQAGRLGGLSLGDYVETGRYSRRFRDDYLLAMGAAIWSTSPARMLTFPAETFVAFFDRHRLLHAERPVWRSVRGGSRVYVERLLKPLAGNVRLKAPVARLLRGTDGIEVVCEDGSRDRFDRVIVAAHSDQALAMLDAPSPAERAILGAVTFAPSRAILHRDASMMPRRRSAWSAWNVLKGRDLAEPAAVTYWLNAVQGVRTAKPLFVTVNPPHEPRDGVVLADVTFAHPQYDSAAIAAQARLPQIQGSGQTWFCGSWTGYGFHEDGLVSGLSVARALGAAVDLSGTAHRIAAE